LFQRVDVALEREGIARGKTVIEQFERVAIDEVGDGFRDGCQGRLLHVTC
jgi:hypothetical protein